MIAIISAEPPEQLSYDLSLFRDEDTQFKKPASHPKTKGGEGVFYNHIECYNEVVNVTENVKNEETLKSYWAKEIAELLDISTSNLRRWSIDLENEGYSFYRDEHHRRAYLERDIMPLKKLKEFLGNNMSKNDAVKAVVSMFPSENNGVITIPVIEDEVRLSKLELQELVQEAVKEAVEEEREAMFQAFEHRMNDTLEKRDRLLTQHLQSTMEERRLEIAAAQEKKWWQFWK
ncbi:hypothetical protein [Priestia megaterium]|uniref:hypothetical protein n=1 Tax=Priestia megaterium TaxID=1404 RepID=UPI001884FAC5|nr:hypothetical protein [Priestia megaterium]